MRGEGGALLCAVLQLLRHINVATRWRAEIGNIGIISSGPHRFIPVPDILDSSGMSVV